MRDTRIVLSFGDPTLDVLLYPFGERGYQPTSQELVEQNKATKEKSKDLIARAKGALAGMLQTIAAIKERRKQTKFKRKNADEADEQ